MSARDAAAAILPVEDAAFAPHGRPLDAGGGDIHALLAAIRAELGDAVELRAFELGAGSAVVEELEIHHRSEQLTLVLDSDWLLTVVAPRTDMREATGSDVTTFRVPAGTTVLLRPGVWHGPILASAGTRVAVAFRAGVDADTEVVELAEPIALPASGGEGPS